MKRLVQKPGAPGPTWLNLGSEPLPRDLGYCNPALGLEVLRTERMNKVERDLHLCVGYTHTVISSKPQHF